MIKIFPTTIEGLNVAETVPAEDSRGSFARWFCARELDSLLGGQALAQINHARSLKAGCVRGLHYQKAPHAEIKFVRCVRGRLWDVAVDLRAGSPTFLRWHAEELREGDNRMMIVPEGFAHGYQALEPGCELLYFNTAFYEPGAEGGVHYADPRVGVDWPMPPSDVSDRDAARSFLDETFGGL